MSALELFKTLMSLLILLVALKIVPAFKHALTVFSFSPKKTKKQKKVSAEDEEEGE